MTVDTVEENKVNYKESYNRAWILALEAMREGRIEESLVKELFEPIPEEQTTAAQVLMSKLTHLESKRPQPQLKGDIKAKFENEFNTLKQVFGMFNWGGNQIAFARRYALLWAAWGATNLSDNLKTSSKETENDILMLEEIKSEIQRRMDEDVNLDGNGGFASYMDHTVYSTLDSFLDFIKEKMIDITTKK